jgi:UDP-N-acetylglucosamine 1-carboxyvinyltransferase
MDTFIIQGGRKLSGTIDVQGAKNSVGPIIAATILVSGESIIHNIPRIGDAEVLLGILESMGAQVNWEGHSTARINCESIDPTKIDYTAVKRIRLSVLLIGALAQRFGAVRMSVPGGCNIGNRSLDAHFEGLKALGYSVEQKDDLFHINRVSGPARTVIMTEFSVTAAENMILASVLGEHTVTFHCIAADPQVQDLCWFLEAAGAKIAGIGTHTLTIEGVSALRPTEYSVMPDPLELGTFIVLAAALHSEIRIQNAVPDFLQLTIKKFEEIGVAFEYSDVRQSDRKKYEIKTMVPRLAQRPLRAVQGKVHTMPYPGFSPDIIQPFALLLTQAAGVSLVHDWMYDGRLRYVQELQKMGANITVLDPHRILIVGPTPLYGKEITSYDIRAGATVVIAALLAEGTSTIQNIAQVDRGYERLDERLGALGASIKRA